MKAPLKLLAVAAFGLTGCDPYPTPPPPYPPPYPPAPAPYSPAVSPPAYGTAMVTTGKKNPFGSYLVDGDGRSLYILEGTLMPSGTNRCVGECLQAWPPLIPNGPPVAGSGIDPSRLTTTPGPAGPQTTYAGWPLYYYHRDRNLGDTTGQHVTDQWGTWHLLSLSGEPVRPPGGY